MGRRFAILIMGFAVMLGCAQGAAGAARYVGSAAQFNAAASALSATGGEIVLEPRNYRDELYVGPRTRGVLRIVGEPGVRLQSLVLDRARSVRVEHLSIRPVTGNARMLVYRSSHVVIAGVHFTARWTTRRVSLRLDHSSGVVVRDSSFAHCGDRARGWSLCLQPAWASHVTVEDSSFHDCRGCDFIHGRAGRDLEIRRNHFARALACRTGSVKCIHQDLIELFAADGLVVSRNTFGVTQRGAAQLYVTNQVNHVRIVNNLFVRRDPRAPGARAPAGIMIGAPTSPRMPRHVTIVNNTVLAGSPTARHDAASILLTPGYARLRRSARPLVANNVIGRDLAARMMCNGRFVRNVVERGAACSASDRVGPALLDNHDRPTRVSELLIDRAAAVFAPPYDLIGRPRGNRPDIGCYEFAGR